MVHALIRFLVFVVLALADNFVVAAPRIVMPDDVTGQEVREVARDLLLKISAGDEHGAKEIFAGQADQAELLDAYLDMVTSFETLMKNAAARNGDGAAQTPAMSRMFSKLADHVKEKPFILSGDFASIVQEGVFDGGMELRRVGGKWKVTHLACDHSATGHARDIARAFAKAAKGVDRDAREGKGATEKDALALMDAHMKPVRELLISPVPRRVTDIPAPPLDKWTAPQLETLRGCLGKAMLSPEVSELLGSLPGIPHAFRTGDYLLITDEQAGMSLSINTRSGLQRIDLYAGRTDGCRQYGGSLPSGLSLADSRGGVERKIGRPLESGGGCAGLEYNATFPHLGLIVNYVKESPRDPDNPIAMISLRRTDATVKVAGAKAVVFPRLTFRLIADNPAVAADELPDPDDKSGKRTLRVSRKVLLDENSVAMVNASRLEGDSPRFGVGLQMTEAGAKKLEQITGENIGHKLAIVLDGQILIAPNIQAKISKHVLITMGEDSQNRDGIDLLGRIHAAVFSVPESKK